MESSKTCTKCDTEKPLDQFSKAPRGAQGRKASCKECDARRHASGRVLRGYNREAAQRRADERLSAPKACTACGEVKPPSEFSKARQGPYGPVLRSDCKACASSRALQWFQDNKERANENRRRWSLEKLYGLSVEQYDQMLADQGGVCAICRRDEPAEHGRTGTKFRLTVDHDHDSGKVRSLLCQKCNRAIGLLGDDSALLRRAAAYIDGHRQSGSRREGE